VKLSTNLLTYRVAQSLCSSRASCSFCGRELWPKTFTYELETWHR